MGIQLDDGDKRMLRFLAQEKDEGRSVYPYLFGALSSSVDLFVSGHNEKRDLEAMWATVKFLDQLAKQYPAEVLRQFACGTRQIPAEDVPSGQ
jgi:hypothetical protein